MLFSVIYSVDAPEVEDIEFYAPPQVEELWQQTEGDEECGYTYLEGSWENGQHRKWGAVLDQCIRLLSAYTIANERLWLISEADRSVTTLLLSREY